ncbi:MAG: hypothetical protein JST54_28225 [Deltaproteobacteria bacterium]|nr:hypothetical protein [Deltaproteobacteria bacterium]
MRSHRTRKLLALMLLGGGLAVAGDALAVVGRPLTPMSYAGVARRTTRRTVYATSAASAGAYGYAAAPAVAPMTALPAGCRVGLPCGGVTYRAAYQGTTLVYVPQ